MVRARALFLSLCGTADHWVQPASPRGTSEALRATLPGRNLGLGQGSRVLPTALLREKGIEDRDTHLQIWQKQAREELASSLLRLWIPVSWSWPNQLSRFIKVKKSRDMKIPRSHFGILSRIASSKTGKGT